MTTNTTDAIETLDLYNSKAAELNSSSFLRTLKNKVPAHRNKRSRLKQGGVADDVRPLFANEFESVVAGVLQAIFWIRTTNLTALEELRGPLGESIEPAV